jgi:hypothetical protein
MRYIFFLLFTFLIHVTTAQTEDGWGLTAGLNYSSIGDLSQGTQTVIDNPDSNIGFHAGIYSKYDIDVIKLRVEFLYTDIASDFKDAQFDLTKLDLPILVGIDVVGPLEFFIGPAAQYILTADIADIEIQEVRDRFTVGAQAGFAVNFGNLGVDIRYERGLTKSEFEFGRDIFGLGSTSTVPFRLDARPEQIILSVSVKI